MSDKEFTREDKISFAVRRIKDMAILYERACNRRERLGAENALQAVYEAENELYDLIGGMDNYKYEV